MTRGKQVRRDWAVILSGQSASGQTAGIYCRERGIPYKSFMYHWRKAQAAAGASRTCVLEASAFVPVRVSASGVLLRVFPGIEVACERLPDASWLAELSRRLSGGVVPPC